MECIAYRVAKSQTQLSDFHFLSLLYFTLGYCKMKGIQYILVAYVFYK